MSAETTKQMDPLRQELRQMAEKLGKIEDRLGIASIFKRIPTAGSTTTPARIGEDHKRGVRSPKKRHDRRYLEHRCDSEEIGCVAA